MSDPLEMMKESTSVFHNINLKARDFDTMATHEVLQRKDQST